MVDEERGVRARSILIIWSSVRFVVTCRNAQANKERISQVRKPGRNLLFRSSYSPFGIFLSTLRSSAHQVGPTTNLKSGRERKVGPGLLPRRGDLEFRISAPIPWLATIAAIKLSTHKLSPQRRVDRSEERRVGK